MRGKFFVVSGIDGCGKSTQAKKLKNYILEHNIPCELTKEPTNGYVGKYIQKIQRGEVPRVSPKEMMHLYTCDRAEHEVYIKDILNHRCCVVSDRYIESSEAYQGITEDDAYRVRELNEDFIRPDCTFIIDVPVDVALARINSRGEGKEIFERKDTLEKVRDNFLDIFQRDEYNKVFLINGEMSEDEVFKQITDIIERYDLV